VKSCVKSKLDLARAFESGSSTNRAVKSPFREFLVLLLFSMFGPSYFFPLPIVLSSLLRFAPPFYAAWT
jgi:hypothetical protein